jgi:predicted phosphodiesterase
MKFQYFSDVHTEQYKGNPKKLKKIQEVIKSCAPYLILAGDIGDPFSSIYKDFLTYLSSIFEYIFIIAGNHEYYGNHDMNDVQKQIKHITSSLRNIIFLEKDIFHLPNTDIIIFGATFWSDILKEEEKDIKYYISDYRCIPEFSIYMCIEFYHDSCNTLNEMLETYPTKKCIVISHHLPSYSLIDPKYLHAKPSLNSAFASNILQAYNSRIIAWIAGHTHKPIEQGKFHVNPIGYKGENIKFDFNKTFEISEL